jgi:hypothetical protein
MPLAGGVVTNGPMQRLAAWFGASGGTASFVWRSPCMSLRADRCRERAAEAKDRAAQARDPFIKSAFENVAAGWVAFTEQVERIDRDKFPVRDEEK